MFTEAEIERASESILDEIYAHDLFDPKKATRQESLDFLLLIEDSLDAYIAALRVEIEEEKG